ncbi:activating signal cointegrator 1 complex subunit 2-like protein [Abeliophyllum distichum]|uniref:Activating signal cointegrator 1 complex subunit 2-like protein n=1 Tax=Abeliophyllum distichum TaxID=126358 RepID=A0ABD1VZH0_9LAMI
MDDDDENLAFSVRIRNASIPHDFCVPKITPYTGKGDSLDHVNTYKIEMSLRGVSPVLKYMSFRLTLSGGVKRWYQLARIEKDIHQLLLVWKTCLSLRIVPT